MPTSAEAAIRRTCFSILPAFVCCCLLLLVSFMFGASTAIDAQGEALLAWKRTLNGSEPALADWSAGDANPCRWTGVSCDGAGRVAELNLQYVDLLGGVPGNLSALAGSLEKVVLAGANLSGPIPPELGALPRLTHLDLSGNALTGAIPAGLCRPGSRLRQLLLNSNRLEGPIPDAIGNLSALQQLIIYDNQLAGPIPPSVGLLSGLQVLRAGGNKNLQGPLPVEIGNCSGLVMLGLAETSISGPLPASLGRLENLETLAVYTALLSGPIPPELGQCGSLQNIYLYENSLSGPIPPQLGRLGRLRNLLLWQNSLVGVIPPELGGCAELAVVDFSMNGLTGRIPPALGNLSALQELQLSVNQISGTIPREIAGCGNLTDLELDNNQISGAIPPELGRLSSLRMLYLWANRLTGSVPPELGDCADLEAVDLSQNGLTGPIPRGIFRLPRLAKLLLLDNDLTSASSTSGRTGSPGDPPGDRRVPEPHLRRPPRQRRRRGAPRGLFEGLVSLQFLDLSNNSVGGALPSELGLLTSLTKLVLGRNRFEGAIPPEIGACVGLQLLDLGGNLLSGEIPASLGRIPALEIALNLSGNGLSGGIPPEFAGLGRLGVLDLSHNRLSGDLRALAGLQNLVALNVSFNDFSGSVPETAFFAKIPIADLEGNPSLCLAGCGGSGGGGGERIGARRAARIATVVVLSAAVALVALFALLLLDRRRRRGRGTGIGGDEEGGKEGEMSPPWEVTLYQKLEIGVGRVPATGAAIAVKRFRAGDEGAAAAFACEIGTLARVRHRNIVRLLGWAANRRTRLLFYDYLPNGTLGELLHGGGGGGGNGGNGGGSSVAVVVVGEWEVRLGIAVGVAEGLAYLHHDCVPAILHRDVKSDNVLLGDRYEACLADFGLARVIADDSPAAAAAHDSAPPPFAGSYGYIAPEYGCMGRITRKSDVYSFGVVLLEIITGRRAVDPAYGEGRGVVQWVREHLRAKRDPAEVVDPRLQGAQGVQEMLQALGIALLCASARPDDRPTMKDVAALLRGIRHDDPNDAAAPPSSPPQPQPSRPGRLRLPPRLALLLRLVLFLRRERRFPVSFFFFPDEATWRGVSVRMVNRAFPPILSAQF
uniref:Protein kinase domain-containing protein n=1 Tax=Ananas comosus var. bracteatus TaxID=296719 RepID=A0A6V7QIY9_ANACO|nr:unnamed protein product [Ananas comosus var. bracteatus]